MAREGVWQLRKLVVRYCDWGGSSRGAREFISSWLPRFQEENPQLAVETLLRRGHHPVLLGEFVNKNNRAVDVKNQPPEEILRQAVYLRSSLGRKATLQIKHRTRTKQPSVQGVWTPQLQDRLKQQQLQPPHQQEPA